jgi:hypothetical protein
MPMIVELCERDHRQSKEPLSRVINTLTHFAFP